ncbi:hypothetical protein ACIBJE_12260 [Micromonospora sp. NPDC050187]|uniref:hypothetical protein n=1 Tax=Micromonospora sp. NPDC050187 TaxID=3364277 RepID=UPI00378B2233
MASESSRGRIGERRGWLVPVLVALAFLGLWMVFKPAVNPVNDSYRYAQASLILLGDSPAEAQRKALTAFCGEQARWNARRAAVDPMTMNDPPRIAEATRECVGKYPDGLTPNTPRYEAIFADRKGYAALVAPLVALFGVNLGLATTSVLFTALGGLITVRLLRELGVPPGLAIAGQVLYYGSPIGWWGSYPLTEGAVLAFTMATLLGANWLLRRRLVAGAALLTAALAAGIAIRFSTFLLIAASLAAAGLLALVTVRSVRHAGTWALVGIGALAAAGIMVMAKVLRLSGANETLQDTFTDHFTRPDVPDPWHRLIDLNLAFWPRWFQTELRTPWLLLGLALGAWALFRRDRAMAWVTLGVAATGLATQAAHPVSSQGDRLYVALWLVPVIGLPVLLARMTAAPTTGADRPGADPAGVPAHRGPSSPATWADSGPANQPWSPAHVPESGARLGSGGRLEPNRG